MHPAAFAYIVRAVSEIDVSGLAVLELGSRDINGTVRFLFDPDAPYVGVDICRGAAVDVVCDAADLDLDDRFDVVVSTELLEHAERGAEIVAAARRHLRPGGLFWATMAGPGRAPHSATGEHALKPGEFYRNVAPIVLESWLCAAGFDSWDIDQCGDDVRCKARVDE